MKIKTFLALLLLVIVGCGCSKTDKEIDPMLYGTWRLVGVSDMNDHLKEFRPNEKECSLCYSITFKKNNDLLGYSTANKMGGRYVIDSNRKISISYQTLTEAGEKIGTDGDLYVTLWSHYIFNIENYIIKNKQLYLYYKRVKENINIDSLPDEGYLLFNKK